MSERKQLTLKRKPKTDTSAAANEDNAATGILGGMKKRIVIAKPEPKQKPTPAKSKKKKPKKPRGMLGRSRSDFRKRSRWQKG